MEIFLLLPWSKPMQAADMAMAWALARQLLCFQLLVYSQPLRSHRAESILENGSQASQDHQTDGRNSGLVKMKMTTVFIYKSTLLVFSAEVDDRWAFRERVQTVESQTSVLSHSLPSFFMSYSGLSFFLVNT